MPGITSAGIGSGLDIEGIISGLMGVERRPITLLDQRKSDISTQLSAIGKIKSAISDFQTSMASLKNLSSFQVYKASSSDDSVFTATSDSTAAAGSYAIDFSQAGHHLAVAHKMQSATNPAFLKSSTDTGASGDLIITDASGATFGVTIVGGTNSTLDQIRDTINNATNNIGVTASVINVDDGLGLGGTVSKLVLSSDKTGTKSAMTLSSTTGNVEATLGLANYTVAADAVFSLDGNTVTSQSNSVTGAIQGVTIDLLAKGTVASTLTISNDVTEVTKSIQGFVDAYNKMNSVLTTAKNGELKGDSMLRSVESQIRNIFNAAPTGLTTGLKYLSEIGITTLEGGNLKLDTTKLETKLKTDFGGVAEMLASSGQGYTSRFEAMAKSLLATDGLIVGRNDRLNDQTRKMDSEKLRLESRMESIEKRYRAQFTAMDQLVAGFASTGNYLAAQLDNLPGTVFKSK